MTKRGLRGSSKRWSGIEGGSGSSDGNEKGTPTWVAGYLDARSAMTSSREGIDGLAPGRVTVIAPAAVP